MYMYMHAAAFGELLSRGRMTTDKCWHLIILVCPPVLPLSRRPAFLFDPKESLNSS